MAELFNMVLVVRSVFYQILSTNAFKLLKIRIILIRIM